VQHQASEHTCSQSAVRGVSTHDGGGEVEPISSRGHVHSWCGRSKRVIWRKTVESERPERHYKREKLRESLLENEGLWLL